MVLSSSIAREHDRRSDHISVRVDTIIMLYGQKCNKHLMTGPKGNGEFCFPETEGNIEVKGKQNSQLPAEPVIKCFVIPPCSKIGNKTAKNRLLDAGWNKNLPPFQGARPDHVRVESCCFPRELVSDQRHVTRSPPNVFELGGITNDFFLCPVNELTSVFHASVLLLIINLVITLSK